MNKNLKNNAFFRGKLETKSVSLKKWHEIEGLEFLVHSIAKKL